MTDTLDVVTVENKKAGSIALPEAVFEVHSYTSFDQANYLVH